MTPPECPVCLELLEAPGVETTPCCRQMMHSKCYLDMVSFYEGRRCDTPCPLCRTLLSEYVAIDFEPAEPVEPTVSVPSPSKTAIFCVVLLTLQTSIILVYKFASH